MNQKTYQEELGNVVSIEGFAKLLRISGNLKTISMCRAVPRIIQMLRKGLRML